MTFTFSEDGYMVQGLNFKGEFQWLDAADILAIEAFVERYRVEMAASWICDDCRLIRYPLGLMREDRQQEIPDKR